LFSRLSSKAAYKRDYDDRIMTVFLCRLRVQEKLTPLVKGFQTSLQYSTIEKEEEQLPPEVNV
jgi:hypothetical protein